MSVTIELFNFNCFLKYGIFNFPCQRFSMVLKKLCHPVNMKISYNLLNLQALFIVNFCLARLMIKLFCFTIKGTAQQ